MKKKLFLVSLAVALVTAGATVGIMFALGVVDVGDDDEYDKGSRYGLLTLEHEGKPDVPFEKPKLRGFKGRQYAKPYGPSFRSGPNIFIIPFGRGQFREGPFREGPPPFFGIEPDGPMFRFRQDGEFLPPAEVICEFMGDAFGEWWAEICDDDYYEYFEYDEDDRDDDEDGDGHDNDDRDGRYERGYRDYD